MIEPCALLDAFTDGDILDVTWRGRDGKTVTDQVDFGGIYDGSSGAVIEHYLWRADGCTEELPLVGVVAVRLVTPRSPRSAEDLRVG
jgi:hypothetical protein